MSNIVTHIQCEFNGVHVVENFDYGAQRIDVLVLTKDGVPYTFSLNYDDLNNLPFTLEPHIHTIRVMQRVMDIHANTRYQDRLLADIKASEDNQEGVRIAERWIAENVSTLN